MAAVARAARRRAASFRARARSSTAPTLKHTAPRELRAAVAPHARGLDPWTTLHRSAAPRWPAGRPPRDVPRAGGRLQNRYYRCHRERDRRRRRRARPRRVEDTSCSSAQRLSIGLAVVVGAPPPQALRASSRPPPPLPSGQRPPPSSQRLAFVCFAFFSAATPPPLLVASELFWSRQSSRSVSRCASSSASASTTQTSR